MYLKRERKAASERGDHHFEYAFSLTGSSPDGVRQEFWCAVTALFERKTDDRERKSILAFVAELCAIERDEKKHQHEEVLGLQVSIGFITWMGCHTDLWCVFTRTGNAHAYSRPCYARAVTRASRIRAEFP